MADTLRLVTFSPGGRPIVIRDLENGSTYQKYRDSFSITAPPRRQQMASQTRRYGGSRAVGEQHDNGTIGWSARVAGATPDVALSNVEGLIADWEVALGGRFIEFRPDGSSASVFFEIRAPAEWTWNYAQPTFAGTASTLLVCKVQVAPLARLAPMDIVDDFSIDTTSDYTFDSGAASQIAIVGGQLTAVSSLTTEKRLAHTVRGYVVLDAQDTVKGTPGATITGYKLGVCPRRSASDTYVSVYVDDNGTNSRLRIDTVVGGIPTNVATTNLAARVSTGTALWVRGRIEGNVVYAEQFTTAPTPMGTPTAATSYMLTAAEQAALPAGAGGITWIPQHAAATVEDFEHLPFTYRNLALPEYIALGGAIPGTADALADVSITPSSGVGAAPVWAAIGWSERPPAYNLVWNGDFEEDVNGWQVAAITGVQAVAGTSITRDASAARTKYGSGNCQIVAPASVGAGAAFPLYRRFRRGATYTATLWASSAAATTSMVLKLGVNGDVATSSAAALGAGIVQWTVTWTPTADREVAYLSFQTNAASATTFNIDGVCAYEGTVAPSIGRHAEGAGAVPPIGILEAESADTGDIAGWALLSDSNQRCGFWLFDGSVVGPETYTAGWWIDPALLVADDFTLGEVDIEFWGRFGISPLSVSPRVVLSARPEWGTAFGAERYTNEHGALGKLLVKPTVQSCNRETRLGTITLPVDPQRPARWKVWLTATIATGSSDVFSMDYLRMLPARRRVASATAKPNDSTYPRFVSTIAETTRTVMSDLRGLVAKPPFPGQPVGGALGGPAIELPPGATDVVVKLSSLVPDDPTAHSASEQLAHRATVHVAVTPRAYVSKGA